jgi:PIN domain nuclease of toxin-antitoxin system
MSLTTHALVWHLEGDSRLGAVAQTALNDASVKKVIPTIVLAEIAFLYSRSGAGRRFEVEKTK